MTVPFEGAEGFGERVGRIGSETDIWALAASEDEAGYEAEH
jgi:hypothetical protein